MARYEPYKHQCDCCEWLGWLTLDRRYNAYLCRGHCQLSTTVLLRYGDKPEEYRTLSVGTVKGSVGDNRPFPLEIIHDAYEKALACDEEYHLALVELYGNNAGDMRYETSVHPDHIRVLSDKMRKATDLYLGMCRANRGDKECFVK